MLCQIPLALFCAFLNDFSYFRLLRLFFQLQCPDKIIGEQFVKIPAAEFVVAADRQYFNHVVKTFYQGNIQRSAAKVEYEQRGILFPVQILTGERRRRRLIDNTFHF